MKKTINDVITTNNTHNDNACDDNNEKQKKSQNISKLLQLPIDLICKTSLYLDTETIFRFETCCILFYQIINNSTYLNQSNTFKFFSISDKELEAMTQAKYRFYKFSKATDLTIGSFDIEYPYGTAPRRQQQIKAQFDKAIAISSCDKWLETMFKSIQSLSVETNGLILLPKLPIDTLFNPDPYRNDGFNCRLPAGRLRPQDRLDMYLVQ